MTANDPKQPIERPELTYAGSFDDYDYKLWGHQEDSGTIEYINNRLITSVLFAERLILNDAWLPLNPNLQRAMFDTKASPLRELINVGWVRILTRNKGQLGNFLTNMAKKMGPHVHDAATNSKLVAELEGWADILSKKWEVFIDFPTKDLTEGYVTLAEKLTELSRQPLRVGDIQLNSNYETDDIMRLIHNVVDALVRDPRRAARTEWEAQVNRWTETNDLSQTQRAAALRLGTILHQTNLCAGLSIAMPDCDIRVDTLSSSATKHLGLYQDPSVVGDDIKEDLPRFTLRSDTPFDADEWGKLVQIAAGMTRARDVLEARAHYLSCARAYIYGRTNLADCTEAAEHYEKKIEDHFFGPKIRRIGQIAYNLGLGLACGAATAPLLPFVGVPLAAGAAVVLAEIPPAPRRTRQLFQREFGEFTLGRHSANADLTIWSPRSEFLLDSTKSARVLAHVKDYRGD